MNNAGYELLQSFDIDNGELDGLSPQEIFCLGVEWHLNRVALNDGGSFRTRIHPSNRERIKRMLIREGRKFNIVPDVDEWYCLDVCGTNGLIDKCPDCNG